MPLFIKGEVKRRLGDTSDQRGPFAAGDRCDDDNVEKENRTTFTGSFKRFLFHLHANFHPDIYPFKGIVSVCPKISIGSENAS